MKKSESISGLILVMMLASCHPASEFEKEIQVTHDYSKNHDLDNNDNFSPDGEWLVYDTRTGEGGIGGCASIERVNIRTGEVQVLYHLPENKPFGPGVGAASYHPLEDRVIFIHGLSTVTEANPYQQWRRTGVMVDAATPGIPVNMDSRDVTFPFTAGALRGGTHRHEWSRDGKWIGYTYNDAIMKSLEDTTGERYNLRTIAVSSRQHSCQVDQDPAGENVQGEWYSAVVVRVVPNPLPGSDEISHAASDSWVGSRGYLNPDGKWQVARAFLGRVTNQQGNQVDELFITDIPDSLNIPGEYGPLEGTPGTMPMPPFGTRQRRLTFTSDTQHPGCTGVVRSSSDGARISFLARDEQGIAQVFVISPQGGEPEQVTRHTSDVQSGVRWGPGDRSIIYVWDNSIVLCEVSGRPFDQRFRRLTAPSFHTPENIVWSNDGRTIAFNRVVEKPGTDDKSKQIFIVQPGN